ncbi:hypothetical protein JKP75_14380 [Blastococcus sp. TML/M2B]|uniref:hypothetical protein n=1 Tax=unclassified Blastococcus TaxID=2619396 RepID=UPI00190CD93B|nr:MULTISPECIES: hypothetical protein [unclassified Blastococcus]MBN1093637.1 hypothetical protein [Blastococcus sp. TML/M2B]MBN1096243.1 hypothetical protein [Blastococcus sp. TML/C7B]
MQRDADRLTAAAVRVEADLRRTTGRPWTCSVEDFALTVTDGVLTRRVELEHEVEEAFVAPPVEPRDLEADLDADADEVVAYEVSEALTDLGLHWPVCPEHRQVMGSCTGWWYCSGETYHDVAEIGSLQAG